MCEKRLKFVRRLLFAAILAQSSWSIAEAAITLTCPADSGTVTIPYSSTLKAAGGVAPYTITITKGALPAGLTLNATTGAIRGTPTTAGKATLTAKVVDSLVAGAGGAPDSITVDCAINIDAAPACTVASVVFTAKDSPLDVNPNAGGGQRIFAEKKKSDEAVLNVVKVTATSNPVVKGKPVFFKSFDVDDPSSDDAPIDPNGKKGNDNRGLPQAGTLSAVSAMTDDNGIATVEFTTTKQPGDNFKVAASCSQKYIDGVVLNNDDGSIIQDSIKAPLPTAHGKLTQMLTVWRKVHIEVDAMKPSAGNFYKGKITGTLSFFGVNFVSTDLAAMEVGRLENGRLVIGANSYGIRSNTADIILAAVPATEVGKDFTAYDDDDFNNNDGAMKKGDTGEALVAPDASLVQDSDNPAMNLLAPAYVRPTYDLPNPTPNPPFVVNQAGDAGADVLALYKFDNRASNSNDYWVIYMLGAYQAITSEDQDPDTEAATSGRVDAVRGQGAVTYLELVSDHELAVLDKQHAADPFCVPNLATWNQTFRNAPTTAHEVGHLFGGLHTDRGLMADKCTQATLTFSDATIAKARDTARP